MPVIKHNKAVEIEAGAVVLDLSDLAMQAKRLAEEARVAAQRLLAQARVQAEQLKIDATARGYKEGFQAGELAGHEQGRREARQEVLDTLGPRLEQLTESWSNGLGQWDRARQDMLLAAGEDVLTFAFELAEKVIGRAVAHDPTLVRDQVKSALSLLSQPTAVTIIVHPDDIPILQEVLPAVIEKVRGCQHAQLRPDDAIARGGCIVRTAGGSVDATIETQVSRIASALLPARDNEKDRSTS